MANVLMVDDNLDLCQVVQTALERDGHRVETRLSGAELTEQLCHWADCILLDVMMPGHPQIVPDILKLVKRIRAECTGKDIWVWTGYKLEELNAQQMEIVDLINVLVDGKFVQDLKDPALIWRGSSNQVVHHLR